MRLLSLLLLLWAGVPARCDDGYLFDVTRFGAVGDGVTKDTAAIRAAAAALAAAGRGGTLLFPGNKRYRTGAFNLSSHSVLKLEAGAVIQGSGESGDYPLVSLEEVWPWFGPTRTLPGCSTPTRFMHSPLVFAWKARNISVVAGEGGTIDGQGWPWWACGSDYSRPPCNCHARPQNIFFSNVSVVNIFGLTAMNPPEWNVHLGWCEDVHVKHFNATAPPPDVVASNSDGIDIDATQRVLIEDSYFSVNDDTVCLKSGLDWWGRAYGRVTRDVLVRNLTIANGEGPAIGSEQAAGVVNATFEDIRLGEVQDGPTIKSCRGRGGLVENITFRRITGDRAGLMPPPVGAGQAWPQLWLRMVWPCAMPNVTRNASATPTFRNIIYEDLELRNGGLQMSIQGLPESPITGVRFKNVSFVGTVGSPGVCGHTAHGKPCPIPGTCHIVPCGTKGQVWGHCEYVEGTCDRDTPVGSCPPCFAHDY